MANIQDLGNELGYIYIVANDGTTVLSNIINDPTGVSSIILDGVNRGPVGGNVVATGTIEVTSSVGNGQLTDISINSVQQNSVTINPSSGDTTTQALLIAQVLNNSIPGSGPDFTAISSGNIVTIYGPSDNPESVNGYIISIIDSSSTTYSITNMSGGSSGESIYSSTYGRRYFYNADFGGTPALPNDLTGSVEITENIINRGLQSALTEQQILVSTDNFSYDRSASIDNISLQGNDVDINTISTSQTNIGDIIIIRNYVSGFGYVNIQDNSVGGGNILLSGQTSWRSDGPTIDNNCLFLQARNDGALSGTYWVEINRSSSLNPDVTTLRLNNFPQALEGSTELALPTSGSVVLDPGVDTKYQEVTGSITLTGNLDISADSSNAIFGDEFYLKWKATPTLSGNEISIQGNRIDDIINTSKEFTLKAHYSILGFWDWDIHYDVYNSTEFILENHLADDIISNSKLQTDSVATSNIQDLNVTEDKLGNLSVTNGKLGAGSVSVDKLDVDLQTIVVTQSVSFETGELAEYNIKVPFDCTCTEVFAVVTKTIEATNDGVLTPKNDAGTTMTGGIINAIAGATNPTSYTSTPTANNTFTAGELIKIQTSKTTAGGKLLVSLTLVRS